MIDTPDGVTQSQIDRLIAAGERHDAACLARSKDTKVEGVSVMATGHGEQFLPAQALTDELEDALVAVADGVGMASFVLRGRITTHRFAGASWSDAIHSAIG